MTINKEHKTLNMQIKIEYLFTNVSLKTSNSIKKNKNKYRDDKSLMEISSWRYLVPRY